MSVLVGVSSIINSDPSGGTDQTQNEEIVEGTLTLSGNYGTASSHGDPVNFTNSKIKSSLPPRRVEIFENQGAGNAPLGLSFVYANGTTQANGVLQVLGTSAAGGALVGATEFTQGSAYSGGTPSLNGAILRFKAWFVRGF